MRRGKREMGIEGRGDRRRRGGGKATHTLLNRY